MRKPVLAICEQQKCNKGADQPGRKHRFSRDEAHIKIYALLQRYVRQTPYEDVSVKIVEERDGTYNN